MFKNSFLFESRDESIDYQEKLVKGQIDRVTAVLAGRDSEKWTKLSKRYKEVDNQLKILSAERDEMNVRVKNEFSTLFDAEDEVLTRVISTVSLTATLAKSTPASEKEEINHAAILDELLQMVPELAAQIKDLTTKHTAIKKVAAKSGALTVKLDEASGNSAWDKIKGFFSDYLKKVKLWGVKYDSKLAALKGKIRSSNLTEKTLTPNELKKREEIVKTLKGKDLNSDSKVTDQDKAIAYAIATNKAKKLTEEFSDEEVLTEDLPSMDRVLFRSNLPSDPECELLVTEEDNGTYCVIQTGFRGPNKYAYTIHGNRADAIQRAREAMKGRPIIPTVPSRSLVTEADESETEEYQVPRVRSGTIPFYFAPDGTLKMLFMVSSDPNFGGSLPQVSKGGVDRGEEIKQAAIREGEEELGLREDNILRVLSPIKDELFTAFPVEINDPDHFSDPHYETKQVVWMTPEEFYQSGRPLHKAIVKRAVQMIERNKEVRESIGDSSEYDADNNKFVAPRGTAVKVDLPNGIADAFLVDNLYSLMSTVRVRLKTISGTLPLNGVRTVPTKRVQVVQ